MYRNSLLTILLSVAFLSSAALAQTTQPVTGMVELDNNGVKTPLAGAKVDLYREDVKGQGQSVKTGSDGKFAFAGVQFGGTFLLSISGPGASPTYMPGIKAGMQNILITMSPGDGSSVTEDTLKTAIANAKSGGSEEDKKKQAELEAKRKEIEAKNKKIVESTAIIEAALKDGNAAYEAKNYDTAIAKYQEGYAAEPDFVGSAPVLLNNKGAALNARAVANYNANVKSTDAAAKQAAMVKVKADFGEAVEAYSKSWEILKNAPATSVTDKAAYDANKVKALTGARESFRLMSLTEQLDPAKAPIAKTLIDEYVAIETDKAKKEASMLILADVFRVAQDSENAIAEYRKVLTLAPDNLDAMAGLGISLVNLGYMKEDKAILQEGADVLQKYATSAPDNHKYKSEAASLIDVLKTEQKIAPQKTSTPAKRRG
jgi:tetratricopeptide (TPR) repeat protein